jgi:hypothetical protein
MNELAEDRLKTLATSITERLVENTIRAQFTRASLDHPDPDDPLNEDDMVRDALGVALGEDTGCLGDEEITAENIDVLFVEQELARIEKNMRDRCFHDFIHLLKSAKDDPPTEDGKIAVLTLAQAVFAQGPEDLGTGKCNCGDKECPYGRQDPC